MGCVVGPKYHAPAVQAPPAYKEVGDWKPAQPNDQNLGGTWWTIFQDPQLDAMELQVNVSNQNLKAAAAQFQQARAALRYNRANYYPTVTVSPSATRTRVSANRPPSNSIFNGITYNDFVLPSTFPTKPTCGGEFEKTWSLTENKRKRVRRTWRRSISACTRTWPLITFKPEAWMRRNNS
jgi:outer membrane protein TolC